ncbi:MAG: hypothetical protein AABW64_03350 [Nanoarchaeota archaeon]
MVRRIESLTERCVYGGYVIERYSVGNLELSNSTLSRIYVVANNRRQAVRRILAVYLECPEVYPELHRRERSAQRGRIGVELAELDSLVGTEVRVWQIELIEAQAQRNSASRRRYQKASGF